MSNVDTQDPRVAEGTYYESLANGTRTALLEEEARASVALDGETQDVGPVTVGGTQSPSEQVTEFEQWNQSRTSHVDGFMAGYEQALDDMERVTESLMAAEVAHNQEQVQSSRIRVWLSRPLTWAEKEALETDDGDPELRRLIETQPNGFKLTVERKESTGAFEYVWVEGYFGSRPLYDLVAAILEEEFVNVYPKAVKTVREYNG